MAKRKRDARGEQTRRRLIRAGLELFGEYGFERVTTRELAARADVNLAAIPYHFGTKEAVYLAVAGAIVEDIRGRALDRLKGIQAELTEDAPRERLVEALSQLLTMLCHELLAGEDADVRAMFIFREQARPTQAFDILYEGFMQNIHRTVSTIVGRILDLPPDDETVILRAHAVLGQVIAFRAAQSAALRRLGWQRYGHEEAERIAQVVVSQTVAALTSPDLQHRPQNNGKKTP